MALGTHGLLESHGPDVRHATLYRLQGQCVIGIGKPGDIHTCGPEEIQLGCDRQWQMPQQMSLPSPYRHPHPCRRRGGTHAQRRQQSRHGQGRDKPQGAAAERRQRHRVRIKIGAMQQF